MALATADGFDRTLTPRRGGDPAVGLRQHFNTVAEALKRGQVCGYCPGQRVMFASRLCQARCQLLTLFQLLGLRGCPSEWRWRWGALRAEQQALACAQCARGRGISMVTLS